MNTAELTDALTTLFSELVDGAPASGAYVLNPGDAGLLGALERLSAADASNGIAGGAPVAAHVDHLRYGISLMNRWASGEENPFASADWSAAWRRTEVTDEEWRELRDGLRQETHRWLGALGTPRDVDTVALNGMLGSIVHLGYHLGAIRQLAPSTRGPRQS